MSLRFSFTSKGTMVGSFLSRKSTSVTLPAFFPPLKKPCKPLALFILFSFSAARAYNASSSNSGGKHAVFILNTGSGGVPKILLLNILTRKKTLIDEVLDYCLTKRTVFFKQSCLNS